MNKRVELSERREEQLYLILLSVADYLRVRPEILILLDWVRIQQLELDLSVPEDLHVFFKNLGDSVAELSGGKVLASDISPDENSRWILSLLIAVLMIHLRGGTKKKLTMESFRKLYRFITLGIEGIEGFEEIEGV
jgi:hypothetical protein